MRITTRMTLTLTLLALIMLGGYGVYVARRSQDELERTVERKTRLIGRGLTAGIERDFRHAEWAHVQDTLERVGSSDIIVRVVDQTGQVRASTTNADESDAWERIVLAQALAGAETFEVIHDAVPMRAVYATPILGRTGGVTGALFVGQSLVGLTRTIAETRRDAAIAVVAFVLAAAAAATWIGRVHVAAPIARLVAAMRRVTTGNLSPFDARERTTEIGELGREFDAMVAQLDAAKHMLSTEEAHRAELERRLRHADKLIAIGHLAAGVAHEVGSPLQVLVGRARSLATRDYDMTAVHRQAAIIAEQGERIAGIVERLLGYTRRHPERPVPTNVGEAAASVVDLLSAEAERRGLVLRCSVAEGDLEVTAVPGTLQQVVLNLAMNAMDATPKGGTVEVSVAPVQGDVEVIVRDDGRGIPDAERERVFDAFYTTRAAQGGTGLGLAVVRTLVSDQGGGIRLESVLGRGTRVYVRFPRARPAERGVRAQA